ncbi:MAG TPA: hypothetical protein VGT08_06200 [Terracidiphilus sp.]|nr:hypothetical protein [Terracidiphilus sp.]
MILLRDPKPSDGYSSEEAIAAAKKVLRYREDFLLHGPKVEAQFVELELYEFGNRLAALEQALNEITAKCRRGPQPPDDFSNGTYPGNRMYAFVWNSTEFGEIYLKFSLTGNDKMACLVLHSFHRDIPLRS